MDYMYANNTNRTTDVNSTSSATGVAGATETEMDQVLGLSVVSDYDTQLAAIAQTMQDQLQQKQDIREEIMALNALYTQPETTGDDGQVYVDLTAEEVAQLNLTPEQAGQVYEVRDGNGNITGYRMLETDFKEVVDTAIENKQMELSQLNSNSELTMIQVQSLVEQRKNAMMLLSNLIAARMSSMQAIIQNMKT